MNKDIDMVRGDTLSFAIKVTGLGQDFTTAFFSCKKFENDTEYVFQKSLSDGITKDSSGTTEDGKSYAIYKIRVSPADTANIDAGNYYYDLQVGVNTDIFTPLRGYLNVEMDVTLS